MIRLSSIVGLAVASAVGGQAMATAILVFDENSQHGLAWTAAQNLAGGGAVLSGMADFDTQLAAGGWDVVAVDCPSNIPAAGWGALEAYVNGGGRVVMTYWDWDGSYVPHNLVSAFGATATTGDVSWGAGTSLTDMGTSSIFAGVTCRTMTGITTGAMTATLSPSLAVRSVWARSTVQATLSSSPATAAGPSRRPLWMKRVTSGSAMAAAFSSGKT